MGQTIKGVFSSKEFRAADTAGQVAMVNNHWDAVAKVASEDQMEEVNLLRQSSVGGIEAFSRGNGATGTGLFKDKDLALGESFNNVYDLLSRGAYYKDRETLDAALTNHDALVKAQTSERSAGATAYGDVRDKQRANMGALVTGLKTDGREVTYGGALTAASSAKDKTVGKEGDLWFGPGVPQVAKDDVLGPSSALSYVKGKFSSNRQVEGDSLSETYRKEKERRPDFEIPEGINPIIPEVLRGMEDSGLPKEQVIRAWDDFVNVNRKWEDGELVRVLSSGELHVNTESTTILTDLDKVKTSILNTETSDYAKEEALRKLDGQRQNTAQTNSFGLYMLSDSLGTKEDFYDTVARESQTDKAFADTVSDYMKRNPLSAPQKLWLSTFKGYTKLSQNISGNLGLLGIDAMRDFSAEVAEANDYITQGMQTRSPDTGFAMKSFGTILEESPQLAYQILLTRGIGGAGSAGLAATGLRGTSLATGATILNASGAIGTSASQSAALTYGSEFNEALKTAKTVDEADAIAQKNAVKAGITTGLVTLVFNVSSFGGLEKQMHNLTMGQMRAEAKKRGIDFADVATEQMRKLGATGVLKNAVGEGGEELTDEAISIFRDAKDNESVADAWGRSWDAALAGVILTGPMSGLEITQNRQHNKTVQEKIDQSEADRERDFELATERELVASFAPNENADLDAIEESLGDGAEGLAEASRAVEEVWTNDEGDTIGMFSEGGVRSMRMWVNGRWVDAEAPGGARGTLLGTRANLAELGFYPRMQQRETPSTITAENGDQFETAQDAIDHLVANELSPEEYEVIGTGDGYVAQSRDGDLVTYSPEEGKAAAGQELIARRARVAAVQERTDARTQRAINEAQAPLTGSSLEQTDKVKREAEKVFKPEFKEAKETLTAKEAAEGLPPGVARHVIDPEAYTEPHEKAASEFLVANGITNVGQLVAAANSPELESATGEFPDALRNAMNVVIQSNETRNIPRTEVGDTTTVDPEPAPVDVTEFLGRIDETLTEPTNVTPDERAALADQVRAMTPPESYPVGTTATMDFGKGPEQITRQDDGSWLAEDGVTVAASDNKVRAEADTVSEPDIATDEASTDVDVATAFTNARQQRVESRRELLGEERADIPTATKFTDLKEQRAAQKGLKHGAKFEFITGEAGVRDPKWGVRDEVAFEAFNPNGEVARKAELDDVITAMVDAGLVKSGWIQAHGSMNDFSRGGLMDLASKNRVTRRDANVAIKLLTDDNNSTEKAINEELAKAGTSLDEVLSGQEGANPRTTVAADTEADTSIGNDAPKSVTPDQTGPPGVGDNLNEAAEETADPNTGAAAPEESTITQEAIDQAKASPDKDFQEAVGDVEEATEQAQLDQDINERDANIIFHKLAQVPEGDYDRLAEVQLELNEIIENGSPDPGDAGDPHMYYDESENDKEDFYHAYNTDLNLITSQNPPSTQALAFNAMMRQMRFNFGLQVDWVDKLPGNALGRYGRKGNTVELSRAVPIDAETPIHELGHAFLAAARLQNPKLYDNLVRDFSKLIKTSAQLKAIRDRVIRSYPEANERLVVEETMVAYIAENGAAKANKDQQWRDESGHIDVVSQFVARAWNAIRGVMQRMFARMAPKDLAAIGPNTRLKDIGAILVNPGTRLDLTQTMPRDRVDPRTMLAEHAAGAAAVADFLVNSIEDAGSSVLVAPNPDGGFDLVLGDWQPLIEQVTDVGSAMISEFREGEVEKFNADLAAYPHDVLGEDFWAKWRGPRSRIVGMSNLGFDPTRQDMLFITNETMHREMLDRVRAGKATPADYDRMKRIGDVHGLRQGWARPAKVTVPEAGASAMRSALGEFNPIAVPASDGTPASLNHEQRTALINAAKVRQGLAHNMANEARSNLDPLVAMGLLNQAYHNEALAASNLDRVTDDPLASKGYTRAQYISGKIPPLDQTWADRQMKRFASRGQTQAQKDAAVKISNDVATDEEFLYAKKAPKKTTVPAKRFGDGTREGFYKAISNDPSFRPPEGPGKLAVKNDGQPHKPFKTVANAQSFRARVAIREGFQSVEMRIVKSSKDGVVSYHVVVPDNDGRAGMARVSMMSDPAQFIESLKDPTVFPTLPTYEEVAKYLEGAPTSLGRKLRKMRLSSDKNPEDVSGDASNGGIDEDRQFEMVDRSIAVNKYQQQWARTVAANKMKALRTKHQGAFVTEIDPNAIDHGLVQNLVPPPGKSPYLSDILEEAMVDTTGYPFNADQLAMIADMRATLENMREKMRLAKLDKKFLQTHGLVVGDFLTDPTKGKKSPRQYFPRLVMGRLGARGQYIPQEYVGPGSTQTEQKGFEMGRMTDGSGNWKPMTDIKTDPQTKDIIYAPDPFTAIGHFLTNSYSAIAAADLATNLQKLERPGIDGTGSTSNRQVRHVSRAIPVLTGLYDNATADYLVKRLDQDRVVGDTQKKLENAAGTVQQIVLGGADLAAPATVALRFTLEHPINEFLKGRWAGGLIDVVKVFGLSVKEHALPGIMAAVMGKVRASTKSVSALDKMHAADLQYYSEYAALGGMLGQATDYQEQADRLREVTRMELGTAAGARKQMNKLRFRAAQWGGGLGDFHRNFSEAGKMMMWKSMRGRFLDKKTGELDTSQKNINRMMEEVRALDRSFGYSNDLQLSPMSRSMRGWTRLGLTAPTMYYSMSKALLTLRGARNIATFSLATLSWYVAAAITAGMEDDEIIGRMDPRNKKFLRIEKTDDDGNVIFAMSVSNFYTSLAKMVGKQVMVAEKVAAGEKVLATDLLNPVASFTKSRRSPFVSGLAGMITGEDFFGRPSPRLGTAVGMYMPLSMEEPLKVSLDRWLGLSGTSFQLTSEETYDTVTERQDLGESTIAFAVRVLGVNIFTPSERSRITDTRDRLFRKEFGVAFDDAEEWMMPSQLRIAQKANEIVGPTVSWGGYTTEYKRSQTKRFLKHLPMHLRRLVNRSGATDYITAPGAIIIGSGEDRTTVHIERGEINKRLWDAAANAATNGITKDDAGLQAIWERQQAEDIRPADLQDEIKDVFKRVNQTVSSEIKEVSGF